MGFTFLLTLLSFVKLDSIPNTGLSFEDKLFHFLAYAVFTFLWYNTFKDTKNKILRTAPLLLAFLFAFFFGTVIEVLQGQLTNNRFAELNDSIANTIGAIFTVIVIKLKNILVKKN